MYTTYSKKIKVGTEMMHKKYGHGVCTKIDPESKDFRYLFKFEDETIIWLSADDVAKGSTH